MVSPFLKKFYFFPQQREKGHNVRVTNLGDGLLVPRKNGNQIDQFARNVELILG